MVAVTPIMGVHQILMARLNELRDRPQSFCHLDPRVAESWGNR